MAMHADLQRRIQKYGWDYASDVYEPSWEAQLRPARDLMMALAEIPAGARVLDVACGTGLTTFPAADAVGPLGEVVGTDISDRMVQFAARQALDRGYANVSFETMDAENLQLPDASFDFALCGLGLMYVPDPVAALREMHDKLKPGGRVSVVVWGERGACGWAEVFPIVDRRVKSEVCPMFFQLGAGNALEIALQMAGFEGIRSERMTTTLDYSSGEDACTAIFAGGPVALAYKKFDSATRDEVDVEYLESIRAFGSSTGYAIPGEFVAATGLRQPSPIVPE